MPLGFLTPRARQILNTEDAKEGVFKDAAPDNRTANTPILGASC
jgi:hypothetical protein